MLALYKLEIMENFNGISVWQAKNGNTGIKLAVVIRLLLQNFLLLSRPQKWHYKIIFGLKIRLEILKFKKL